MTSVPIHVQAVRTVHVGLPALAALLAGTVMAQGSTDRWLMLQINAWAPALSHTASALSVLGLGATFFIVAAALGLREPRVPAASICVLLVGGLLLQILKSLLDLPRPAAVLGGGELVVIGTVMKSRAMPSGHAALFAASAGLVALLPPASGPRRWRWFGAAAVWSLAIAGCLARVVVGAHWPSDVFVGAGLGLACACLLIGSARGRQALHTLAEVLDSRAGSRAMAALVVGAAATLWVAERDYPLAEAWYAVLAALGLLVAPAWWRRHRAPAPIGQRWRRRLARP